MNDEQIIENGYTCSDLEAKLAAISSKDLKVSLDSYINHNTELLLSDVLRAYGLNLRSQEPELWLISDDIDTISIIRDL